MRRIDVSCAVIMHRGQILICRRAPHKSSAGLWEFPGGKVEANENPLQCILRELQEELDLDANVFGDYGIFHRRGSKIWLHCFLAEPRPGSLPTKSDDHDVLQYIPLQYMQTGLINWAPADIPIVEQLWRDPYVRTILS